MHFLFVCSYESHKYLRYDRTIKCRMVSAQHFINEAPVPLGKALLGTIHILIRMRELTWHLYQGLGQLGSDLFRNIN